MSSWRNACIMCFFVLPRTEAQMAKGIWLALKHCCVKRAKCSQWTIEVEWEKGLPVLIIHYPGCSTAWHLSLLELWPGGNSGADSLGIIPMRRADFQKTWALEQQALWVKTVMEWSPSLSPTPHTKAAEGNSTSVYFTAFIRFYMRRGT